MTIRQVALVAAHLFSLSSASFGLINPNFTPLHIVKQSDSILNVEVRPGEKPLTLACRVTKVLKGKEAEWKQPIAIDLSAAPRRAMGEAIAGIAKEHTGGTGLLFVGEYVEEMTEGSARRMAPAFLHFDARWISLYPNKAGGFDLSDVDTAMEGTFSGATDQWKRCVKYVLADAKPSWPVTCRAMWASQSQLGNVRGKVASAVAIWFGGSKHEILFIACDSGDRLFEWNGKERADVTARRKLVSKSQFATWGDFNGDGLLDLASWDGRTLTLHLQQKDGTFAATKSDGIRIETCLGLATLDVGVKGRVGLLVSTVDAPLVLSPGQNGKWTATPLEQAPRDKAATQPEKPGACLVADLDNDGLPDVIQMFANASLLFGGTGVGKFAPGRLCEPALGEGRSAAWLGDWDHDGQLDIMCVAEDGVRLWQNLGGGRFADVRSISGTAFAYMTKPGGIAGGVCDLNDDGRPDALIVYGNMSPMLFFNCGFRRLAHAHDMDLQEKGLLPVAADGLQAGCMGDFNGDGAQDLAVVCKDGSIHVFYRKVHGDSPPLGVRVTLPAGSPGPVRVVGELEHRSTGAWNVTAGSSVPICRETAGTITLKWQFPGQPAREEKVKLVDKPIAFTLTP
ncbi:MAG: VCBS repeat-containing protein [Phycisphaerae bacterium]|nr:VCBS repeat-containing protein [Phycisphaerae bacterium]